MGRRRLIPVALVVATLLHGGYRVLDGKLGTKQPVLVSGLSVGNTVPSFTARRFDNGETDIAIPGPGCTVVVVFDPACPHCRKAAEREAQRSNPLPVPTIWVTERTDSGAAGYRQLVHPESDVGWALEVGEHLEIRAVPAAFVIRSNGEVGRVGPYRGNEKDEAVRSACAGVH